MKRYKIKVISRFLQEEYTAYVLNGMSIVESIERFADNLVVTDNGTLLLVDCNNFIIGGFPQGRWIEFEEVIEDE